MDKDRPFMITFIGDGCVFGAFILILSLFPKFLERFRIYSQPLPNYLKVSVLSENIMLVLFAVILLIIAYGYFKLRIWSYWLLVGINLYSLIGGIVFYQQNKQQSFYQNPIGIVIGLVFILPTIKYFGKKTIES